MPHTKGVLTILRSRRTSFQNVEETREIDFRLGTGQGVELYRVEFGIRGFVHVPADDAEAASVEAHMSLHMETGGLEGSIDSFPADQTILNSEIIAEATLGVYSFISSVAAASGNSQSAQWLQPNFWNFKEILGDPLIIAQNLTFRGVTSSALLTVNGAQVTIYYKIVTLTTAQIVNLFSTRR